MKYIKRISIICILILFAAGLGNLYSQDKGKNLSPDERAKKISDKMQTELNLSQDQYNKIYQSHLDFFAKVKTLRDNTSTDKESMKTTMKEYRADLKNSLKSSLSDDQMKKWKETKKSKMHKNKKDKKVKKDNTEKKEFKNKKND